MAEQMVLKERLMAMGYIDTSEPVNRNYFHSLYFKMPGGVIFEAATTDIGFAIDEAPGHFGEEFQLPPWLRERKDELLGRLSRSPFNPFIGEAEVMSTPRILVVFYSRNRSTELLAQAVAEGAMELGADVRLRRVREMVGPEVMRQAPGWLENATAMNARYEAPTEADAEWADAIVFGTPTRFGAISSELKAYIDGLGGLWFQGKLNGKAGSVFGSTSSRHGGNESTLLSIYPTMAHLGLIIVRPAMPMQSCSRPGRHMAPPMSRTVTPTSRMRTISPWRDSRAAG